MTSRRYFPATKTQTYLQLLRFSRLVHNTISNTDSRQCTTTITALNSLPTCVFPARPLLPLLYRNAVYTDIFPLLTREAQEFLKENTMILVGQEISNQRWLENVIESLRRRKIRIILLKGAAFAGNLYTKDAPRPGLDTDFLVKNEDFDSACEILAETMSPVTLAKNRLATHRTLFERVFVPRNRASPVVEIHRGLTNPYIFNISENSLWETSQQHPAYGSADVRVLSPENTLLHLAVHAFRDMDFCNHNLLDVHELIHQQGIDEENLYRGALEWGNKAILFYLLHNAKTILKSPVSTKMLAMLEPDRVRKRVHQRLLASNSLQHHEKKVAHRMEQLINQLSFPDRLSSALKFQGHYAITRLKDLRSH